MVTLRLDIFMIVNWWQTDLRVISILHYGLIISILEAERMVEVVICGGMTEWIQNLLVIYIFKVQMPNGNFTVW